MQCSGLFASFVLSLDKINLNLIKNKGWCRLMLIKYSEFLHWQCLMILLRVVDLISSNIPPSSSASMLDRDSWWFLSVSLLVPCQSFVFIQIWNHDFTKTHTRRKLYHGFSPRHWIDYKKRSFWFYEIIQIHYDACQITDCLHEKRHKNYHKNWTFSMSEQWSPEKS